MDPNASMTTTLADVAARDPAQVAATEAMLTRAFDSFFSAHRASERDQFMIVGRTFHRLAGELGLRNRQRAFGGAANTSQLIRIAATLLEAAKFATQMSLTQLEPHVAAAVAQAFTDQQNDAPLDATYAALGEYDGSASPDARDPHLRIVELEDELAQQQLVLRETSQRADDRFLQLENMIYQQQAQLAQVRIAQAPLEEPDAATAVATELRATQERLEQFIEHVNRTSRDNGASDSHALQALRAEMIGDVTAQIAELQLNPGNVQGINDAVAKLRREYDASVQQVRREVERDTQRKVDDATSVLHHEFGAELRRRDAASAEQAADARAEMERKIEQIRAQYEHQWASQPTGTSPATRQRISTVEDQQAQVMNRTAAQTSEMRQVRGELNEVRDSVHRFTREWSSKADSLMDELVRSRDRATSSPAGPTRDEIRNEFSSMLQNAFSAMRDEMRSEIRHVVSQSLPRESIAPARHTFAASDATTTDTLAEATLAQRRRDHDRLESKGRWAADFIVNDSALTKAFNSMPVTYSWLKKHAMFDGHMVETLRLVGRTFNKLENKTPQAMVDEYFEFTRTRLTNYDLTLDEREHLETLVAASGSSATARVRFIEEIAIRGDIDTKIKDRADRLKMLNIARMPELATLSAAELDKVLSGERSINTHGESPIRLVARKGKSSGFQ